MMLDVVLPDLPFTAGDNVAVLVSGLGATPVMELYILYAHVDALLRERGITPARRWVGNYFTSLEMMGATLTVMRLDEELTTCLDAPCESPGLTQFGTS
jgi:dihydroxyacetone kinase-like protein